MEKTHSAGDHAIVSEPMNPPAFDRAEHSKDIDTEALQPEKSSSDTRKRKTLLVLKIIAGLFVVPLIVIAVVITWETFGGLGALKLMGIYTTMIAVSLGMLVSDRYSKDKPWRRVFMTVVILSYLGFCVAVMMVQRAIFSVNDKEEWLTLTEAEIENEPLSFIDISTDGVFSEAISMLADIPCLAKEWKNVVWFNLEL